MAVEAVVALMVDKLDKLLSKEAQLLGVHGEINWIREELDQMRRFLKDADIKQKEDEDVRDWMEDIRDICFDVDDVIDILGQGQAAKGRHGFVERLKRCISDQITRYKVSKEIERIKLSIKGISRSRESYGIREIIEERQEATSPTQRFQEVSRCSVPPEKIEIVITTVDDQSTNEERTRDIDEGRQGASSSSRNLQAHRRVSTLPGEPEEVGLQEELNTVGQPLIEEEPRLWDGTRDISEGKLEASSSTPGLKADRRFSTLLEDSEEVGLQEGINPVGQQLIKEEPGPYVGTRDIDEGRLEASSSAPSLQADRWSSTLLGESEEVGLQEGINTVSEGESEAVGLPEVIDTVSEQSIEEEPGEAALSPLITDMAEAALSPLITDLLKKMASPLLEKFGSICRVNKELNNLCSTFTAIQAVLKDAEERQCTSYTIRDWLDKLQDVAYEVEDILDEFATEDLRQRVEIRNSTTKKVRDFLTPSKNLVPFKSKMSNKVREVAERLDVIAREKSNYNLRQEDVDRRKETEVRVQTRSYVPESEALGREEDKDKLVHLLVNRGDEVEENVSVVPIVGMGGLGKTTLAKLVYDDEKVISYFDQRMWVFVSEKFDRAEIMKASIASVNDERCDLEHMYPLQSRLRKTLSGKRYLLVLDDVWNENQEAWLQLKSLLSVGEKGSKIIVTTRSNIVANMMGTLPTHHLEGLQEEDCWSLFKQRAFPNRDEETYPDLVLIGREIVKKCKGVPLVAKVLGGLLHYKRREREWLSIRNNEIWELKEDEIMPTLRLSYNHLPSQLKQCFTYCIIFHKGGTFKQQEVIQMWIAQGLIQSSEEGKLMEDIGAEYFDELCWRSFFQEVMYHVDPHVEELEYKMHDHIYDLAKSVRRTECLTVKARRIECVPSKTRHFSFVFEEEILLTDLMLFHNAQKLQTLILENIRIEKHVILEDISSLTCLRVLKLYSTNIKTLPNSIGKLKHLRYLDLFRTDIETLPESICTLWNLQTLKLLDCRNLRELPNNMWKMISLRHLEIRGSHRITEMPARISKLSDLQTLTLFIVSKENGIDELRDLNLRGSINIQNLQNVLNPSDADKVGLRERHKLSSLGLSWKDSHDSTVAENENCERVIESLQPHLNLQSLSIENYMGSRFPHWLMHLKVPNLIKISLINCRRCEILPPFSQLHHLKDLTIQDMPDLEKWSSDERSQTLPHIKRLEIINCPKLTQMPHLPSAEILKMMGCNEMLLMSIRNYTEITKLWIGGFPEMISLPEGLLKNLTLIKDLNIEDCPKLKSLSKDVHDLPAIGVLVLSNCGEVESLMEGVRNLTSLRSFCVSGCNHLTSLLDEGFQGLTSLQDLWIRDCDKLRSLGEGLQVQHLNSLAFLCVGGCPELAALPKSLFNLTALKSLFLLRLPKLASLSEEIGNLASLEELGIARCPHLLSLPASLQKVMTLQTLRIESCPSLERRCAKEKGEDWYKIAHVSVIEINGQCLQERK